jgi:hypothetical protein
VKKDDIRQILYRVFTSAGLAGFFLWEGLFVIIYHRTVAELIAVVMGFVASIGVGLVLCTDYRLRMTLNSLNNVYRSRAISAEAALLEMSRTMLGPPDSGLN